MIRSWEMAFAEKPIEIIKKTDDTNTLPPELLTTILLPEILTDIFTSFHFKELLTFATVSVKFNELVNDPLLLKRVIYRDMTFNPDDWKIHFKDKDFNVEDADVAFKSLPITIGSVFKSQFLEKEEKKFGETHVIVWKPAGISLSNYIELLKKSDNFRHIRTNISYTSKFKNQLTEKSEWLVMTRKVLKDSPSREFTEHEEIIKKLPLSVFKVCAIPAVLEAFIAVSAIFIKFGTKIFEGSNVARCTESPSQIYQPEDPWYGVPLSVDFNNAIHISIALFNNKLGLSPVWKL